MHPIRQRLWNPPNAVEDTGITMRNGWPVRRRPKAPVAIVNALDRKKLPKQKPIVAPPEPSLITFHNPKEILAAVCQVWQVPIYAVLSERRHHSIVVPRHVVMALMYRLTKRSYPRIGQALGGRDHTTILHGVRKMRPHIEALDGLMPEGAAPREWAFAMKARLEMMSAD